MQINNESYLMFDDISLTERRQEITKITELLVFFILCKALLFKLDYVPYPKLLVSDELFLILEAESIWTALP